MFKNKRLCILSSVLIFLTVHTPCRADTTEIRIKAEYDAAKADLEPYFVDNGFRISGNSQALSKEWSLIGEWTIHYLNTHPSPSLDEFESVLKSLDPDLGGKIIPLDTKTYLVSVSPSAIGNVFIVAAQDNEFRVVWDIAQSARTLSEHEKPLAAWSADAVLDNCENTSPRDECSSLSGDIRKLPDDINDNHRFYIDAVYGKPMGATVGIQLSFWKWNGETATPLFVGLYDFMSEQRDPIRFDGDIMHVLIKDEFKTVFACGSCEGRQMDWLIRITPEGIEDLGKESLVPELDLIDEVYYRIAFKKPIDGLATPAVIKVMKKVVDNSNGFLKADNKTYFSMGLLNEYAPIRKGDIEEEVCFGADGFGTNGAELYLFSIKSVGGKLRIVDVKDPPDDNQCSR